LVHLDRWEGENFEQSKSLKQKKLWFATKMGATKTLEGWKLLNHVWLAN
jgi:hypothetical protein